MPKPCYLTKSRFKLGLDCDTKLFYTRKSEYENTSETDSFLESLAQGGFQVEELARMYHPNGIAILGNDWNYDQLAQETAQLLEQENVTIFEAAFLIDGLFIRVDILEKKGNNIKLIEVKAKSIDSSTHLSFIKKNKNLSGWDAFLYDVAFQQFVIQKCYPDWKIKAYLNLVDKSKKATVDGLHSHFRITPNADLRTGVTLTPGLSREDLGDSILATIPVIEEVTFIHTVNPHSPEISFQELIFLFRDAYRDDQKINTPIGGHCAGCEFRINEPSDGQKSGYHECWMEQLPSTRPDLIPLSRKRLNAPRISDVWDPRFQHKVYADNRFFMDELTEEDINIKPQAQGMSRTERQWIQIEKTTTNDPSIAVDEDNLRHEISQWKYPLNFIDFETSAVAIPFFKGMRPYEQVAFQFSHHIVYEDGRVEHAAEYINLSPGDFPNFKFIRALKATLETNEGSIFRYHNHENTIVNNIYEQLKKSSQPDKAELMAFIKTISHNTGSSTDSWRGDRDMIDLYKVVIRNYYNPQMGKSNSIKAVLPAVLQSSELLKEKYGLPISSLEFTSLNFDPNTVFIHFENGLPVNPYKLLPDVFEGISNEDLDRVIENSDDHTLKISDGGVALFVYAKMQHPEISDLERKSTTDALLRYCELDTLAMVMIFEHFKELCE